MVNIDDNISEKSITFDENDMEFDGINSEYVYPDSPDLSFADDENDEEGDIIQDSLNTISPSILDEENEGIDFSFSIIVPPKTALNCNSFVAETVEIERNEEDTEKSRRQHKRPHSSNNNDNLEIVKSKKRFRRGSSDESISNADINNKDDESISQNDDLPDDDGCFKNIFEGYNKLFSSKNYPRICPYSSLKEIDKNIPIKQKSGLSLLFPISAFLDRKIKKSKFLSWNSDRIKPFENLESEAVYPLEDKLLSDCKDETNIINPFDESIESPKPLLISDELIPKTEYEKNYWKILMPRIGFNFVIQPGMVQIEKEKWLRLKEIDALNGYEWTEMDTGFDL
uniref:Uncharacterized protein n=1 Tax=Panagrolaimus sp. ES5 TaxID=591445 RepID=A0AC34FB08_9BILA